MTLFLMCTFAWLALAAAFAGGWIARSRAS